MNKNGLTIDPCGISFIITLVGSNKVSAILIV